MRSFNVLTIAAVIGLILIGAQDSRGQSNPSQENILVPRSTSPFEIARIVNLAARNWNELKVDLGSTWKRLTIEPGDFAECDDCRAKIFRSELDGKQGREVILKLTRSLDFCRYLVFSRRGKFRQWKLLGYVDHDFNRYELSRHRIERALGKTWLVIRGQEGSGSGYALYAETWYEVNDHGVRAVLNYPIEGNTYPWPTGLGRKFKAYTNARRSNPRENEIRVRYAVTYTILDYFKKAYTQLYVNHHDTYYVWDKKNQTFVYDERRSGITQNEIDAIAGIETENASGPGTKIGSLTFYSQSETTAFTGGGYEVFLKYNSQRLMKIAKGKNSALKQWLKQFLVDCDDIAEKNVLLKVLEKQQ